MALTDEATRLVLLDQSVNQGKKLWRGGPALFIVWSPSTIDFSQVTLQISPDDGVTWVPFFRTARFGSNGCTPVELPEGPVQVSINGLFGGAIVSAVLIKMRPR